MAYKDAFKVEGGKINRPKSCVKCGPGYLLAAHKNRLVCGKCRYVEFKKE